MWSRIIRDWRIVASRSVVLGFIAILLFTEHSWPEDSLVDILLGMSGIILIAIGTFGRLWSSLYVAGYKTTRLITEGPYSITRNPLYFFSFIGSLGVAITSEMITVVVLYCVIYTLYYPWVIKSEEQRLLKIHQAEFADYCRNVPRFWPRLALLREPDYYSFNTRLFRRAVFDSMVFFLMYVFLELLERLHEIHWLPTWWHLY